MSSQRDQNPSAAECWRVLFCGFGFASLKYYDEDNFFRATIKHVEALRDFCAYMPQEADDQLSGLRYALAFTRHLHKRAAQLELALERSKMKPSHTTASTIDGTINDSVDIASRLYKISLARCEALLRSGGLIPREEGQGILNTFREVFDGYPLLMHISGDGMALLSNKPESVICVGPLREDMARTLCEQVMANQLKLSTETSPLFAWKGTTAPNNSFLAGATP